MNGFLLSIGAIILATLATLGTMLLNVNSAASKQLSRTGTTRAVELVSARLTEALEVPQDAAKGSARVEWPTDVSPWLTCTPHPLDNGSAELCVLSPGLAAAMKAAESIFVCPVTSDRAGLDTTNVAAKQDFFFKADITQALAPTRPVAFIIESNPERFKGAPVAEAAAVNMACDILAQATLLPAAGGAVGVNGPDGLPDAAVAALQATGVRGWKVLTVGEGLQTKGARHIKDPVVTKADLAAFTLATGAAVGDMRLVKDTGILTRFDGVGWYSTFAPAPMSLPNYDMTWRGNTAPTAAWPGPFAGNDTYLPIPATTLTDGTVVPTFKVGVYNARYLRNWSGSSVGYVSVIAHDGYRDYVSSGNAEPPVATGYTWQQAKSACEAIGEKLPSLNQWLALAQRATQHPSNWSEGHPGAGTMKRGASTAADAAGPVVASRDFAASHFGLNTSNFESSRTFQIQGAPVATNAVYNGAWAPGVTGALWDLAGNAAEWIDWTVEVSALPVGDGAKDFCAWGEICGDAVLNQLLPLNQRPAYKGVPGGWLKATSAQNNLATNNVIGVDGCVGACASTSAVAVGGSVQSNAAGVYTFDTRWGRSYSSPFIGFRCVAQVECLSATSCFPTSARP